LKNRIVYACKKLTKKLSNSTTILNSISKNNIYSNETFDLLLKITRKSYLNGIISESEFISLLSILGKNENDFNSKGFIEKTVVWFFADLAADLL
jgi:hypothetical protein